MVMTLLSLCGDLHIMSKEERKIRIFEDNNLVKETTQGYRKKVKIERELSPKELRDLLDKKDNRKK